MNSFGANGNCDNVLKNDPPEDSYGFPGGSVVKNPSANARDTGDPALIPGSERSPGEGNGNPLYYSSLESPMDRGVWWATVDGVTKSQTHLSTQKISIS